MRNPNAIATSESRQTVIHSTNQALEAVSLKPGPRLLLARIILWSGKRGACWYAVGTMAARLGVSERQIQRWKQTLITKGFLAELARRGGSPYLIPYPRGLEYYQSEPDTGGGDGPGGDRFVTRKEHETNKEKTLVEGNPNRVESSATVEPESPVNAFNLNPSEIQAPEPIEPFSASFHRQDPVESEVIGPQRPVPPVESAPRTRTSRMPKDVTDLVEQIERTTNDHRSRGAFIRIARNVDEQTIYRALSSVRCAMECGTVYRPGAYFISTVKAISGFQFQGSSSRQPSEKTPSDEPWCNLSVMQGMYPHLKVDALWKRYKEIRPEADLDKYRRFLQLHDDEIWETKPHYRR